MEEEQNIPNCQTGEKIMLPAGNMKISHEQNIELISPPGQLKRDTDSVIAEDWKLGKIACCEWVAIIAPSYGMNGSWERSEFRISHENCVTN